MLKPVSPEVRCPSGVSSHLSFRASLILALNKQVPLAFHHVGVPTPSLPIPSVAPVVFILPKRMGGLGYGHQSRVLKPKALGFFRIGN